MNFRLKGLLLAAVAMSTISLSGCGEASPELVPVKGIVKIDGKPAQGIMVRFIPDVMDESVKAPSSQGITDASGEFSLSTSDNQPGAVKGKHKVSLIDTLEERVPQGQTRSKPPRLAAKFSKPGALDVTIDGPKDENDPVLLEASAR